MATKYSHLINFSGNVIETIVTSKASAINEWVSEVRSIYNGHRIVVGLDCEWKPNYVKGLQNRTAILQLCVDKKCLVVQMLYLDYIPQSLAQFFSDPNVTFVGAEVDDDMKKLKSEYGLISVSTADIQAMAMTRWPIEVNQKPSLKNLAQHVAGLSMSKPAYVCQSNWEAISLSQEQVEYAYTSYRVGHKLINVT